MSKKPSKRRKSVLPPIDDKRLNVPSPANITSTPLSSTPEDGGSTSTSSKSQSLVEEKQDSTSGEGEAEIKSPPLDKLDRLLREYFMDRQKSQELALKRSDSSDSINSDDSLDENDSKINRLVPPPVEIDDVTLDKIILDTFKKGQTLDSESNIKTKFCRAVSERNLALQAVALHELGLLHFKSATAKSVPDPRDFIQSNILLNAAYCRSTHTRQTRLLSKRISAVEREFLKCCCGIKPPPTSFRFYNVEDDDSDDDEDMPVYHPLNTQRNALKDLRGNVQTQLQRIYTKLENIPQQKPEKESLSNDDLDLLKDVDKICGKVNDDFKSIFRNIVKECTTKLGNAPCKYAIVLVGDAAINVLTPYSDVEYVVLVADSNMSSLKYFYNLCHHIELKISSLGETPLTYTRLKFFNDFFNKSISQFCDTETVNGIKVVSGILTNSLTPLCTRNYTSNLEGLSSEVNIDFIKTPKEMAKFANFLQRKNMHGLAVKLHQHEYLFGEYELYKLFKMDMDKHFSAVSLLEQDRPRALALEIVNQMFCKINLDPSIDNCEKDVVQLKDLVYEIDSVKSFLFALKLVLHIPGHTIPDILQELKATHGLSEEGETNLKLCFSLSYLLKCCGTVHQNSQCIGLNTMVYCPSGDNCKLANIGKNIFGFDMENLLALFYTAYSPLQNMMKRFADSNELGPLKDQTFFSMDSMTVSKAAYRLNKYLESIESMRSYISYLKTSTLDPYEKWEMYLRLGNTALNGKCIRLAKACFTRAMEIKEKIKETKDKRIAFMYTWYSLGLIHLYEDKFDKAQEFFLEAIAMLQDSNAELHRSPTGHAFLYKVQESLYKTKYRSGKLNDMLPHLNQALRHLDESKVNVKHRIKRKLLFELAQCQLLLTMHKDCLATIKKVYEMDVQTDGLHFPTVRMASNFRLLSQLMQAMGKEKIAAQYGDAAFRTISAVLDKDSNWLQTTYSYQYEGACAVASAVEEYMECASTCGIYAASVHAFDMINGKELMLKKQGDVRKLTAEEGLRHFHLGKIYLKASNGKDAYDSFQKCLEIFLKVFGKKQTLHLVRTHCMIGFSLNATRKYENALDSFTVALLQAQSCLPDNKPSEILADIYEQMAEANHRLNRFQKATVYFEDSIKTRKELYGETHPVIAQSLKNQGLIFHQINEPARAIKSLEQAVQMIRVLQGHTTKSPEIANLIRVIGMVYMKVKEFKKAEANFTAALAMYKEVFGEDSSEQEIVDVLMCLGDMHIEENDVYKAINIHKQCLEVMRKAYGTDDLRVARLVATIAHHYHQAQLYSDATKIYENAIAIHRRVKGKAQDGAEVADWLINLAKSYEIIGEKDKASDCHKRALEINQSSGGQDIAVFDLIESLKKLAETEENKGHYQQANTLRKQAYEKVMAVTDNKPHPDAITALESMSCNYLNLKEFDDALDRNEELIKMLAEMHGKDSIHPQTAGSLLRAGVIHQAVGRIVKAISNFRKSLAMYRAIYGNPPDHHHTALCLNKLGHALDLAGEGQEAVTLLKEGKLMLERLKMHKGEKMELYCQTLYYLGLALETHPNFPEALMMHEHAFQAWKTYLTLDDEKKTTRIPKHIQMADCYQAIGRTFIALNDSKEGIKYLNLHIEMRDKIHGKKKLLLEYAHYHIELGHALVKAERLEDSILEYTKALHIMRQIYGKDKPQLHVAECLGYLATSYKDLYLFTKSIELAKEALDIYELVLEHDSKDHPTLISLTSMLGDINLELGKPRTALKQYQKALQYYMNMHGDNSFAPDVEKAMRKLVKAKEAVEKVREAKRVAAEERANKKKEKSKTIDEMIGQKTEAAH